MSNDEQARCRSAWTRHIWKGFADSRPNLAREVWERIEPRHAAALEKALPISWLPLAVHMEVLEKIHRALGTSAYQTFWYERTKQALKSPLLFGRAVRTAVRGVGANPLKLLLAVPPSLPYVLKDAGTMNVSLDAASHRARVVFADFPAVHATGLTWAVAWRGALEGIMDFISSQKFMVAIDEHRPEDGYFEYLIEKAPT